MEGTLDEVVVVIGEVWHVHIGVLKPTHGETEGGKKRVNVLNSRKQKYRLKIEALMNVTIPNLNL